MKLFKYALLIVFALPCLLSCQNNGDIGDLYGKWKLKEIITPDTTINAHDLYINFQATTFEIQYLSNPYSYEALFGSFTIQESAVSFSYPSEQIASSDRVEYITKQLMYMTIPGTYQIEKESNSQFIISRNDTILNFKKY